MLASFLGGSRCCASYSKRLCRKAEEEESAKGDDGVDNHSTRVQLLSNDLGWPSICHDTGGGKAEFCPARPKL